MPKLLLRALHTEDANSETGSATRDRLKGSFPPGTVRRMTQLGLLVGHCLGNLPTAASEQALVYASRFAEGRALEDFLASFPDASPTGFQTSIHPSGAQQGMIVRKRPVRSFFPLTGGRNLAGQALLTALLCPEPLVTLCGGEERGTWLTEVNSASDCTYAFALCLEHIPALPHSSPVSESTPLAELALEQVDTDETGALSLTDFFEILHRRLPFEGPCAPGWRLNLRWC